MRREEIATPSPVEQEIERLPRAALESMLAAGQEVLECMRVLEKVERNLVGELLRTHPTFYELEHIPPDDVFDSQTHSQYYYHAHRGLSGEHGHFHAFLRAAGMPEGAMPLHSGDAARRAASDEPIAHLVAISMDGFGRPMGLFTTNRWVTDETWYPADQVVAMLDRFQIDHADPSWPVNRWISAMMRLFRPQIEWLVRRRDEAIARRQAEVPDSDVFEDRALEVTSELNIDIGEQLARVRDALSSRAGIEPPEVLVSPEAASNVSRKAPARSATSP